MSVVLQARVGVDAVPEVVWAALMDWPAQREWIPGTEVAVVSGDGRSVGSTVWAFTGIGGLGFLDKIEIVEWEPPKRCRIRHAGRLVRGYGTFAVEPRGGVSTFVLTEEIDPPLGPLGRAAMRLGRPVFEAVMRRVLRGFAVWCLNPR